MWVAENAEIATLNTYAVTLTKGHSYKGTVTLDGMSPINDAPITLTSQRSCHGAGVVTIPDGLTSATFNVSISSLARIGSLVSSDIRATYRGRTLTVRFTGTP